MTPQPFIENTGWIIAGALALAGVFNAKFRERRRESDETATNLINNLRTTVEVQEKSIAKMQHDMDEHTKQRDIEIKDLRDKVHNLSGRNSVLEDLFKGRDPAMQLFLKDAPNLMTIARQNNILISEQNDLAVKNNDLAVKNSEAITALTNKMTELVSSLITKKVD